MLFASFSFILFLLVTVVLYFLAPTAKRWIVILIVSIYFYLSLKPEWAFLILISILVNYGLGIGISKLNAGNSPKAKIATYFGVTLNLLYLIVFKYANFISDSVSQLVSVYGVYLSPLELAIILPVGISFYTFQNISYLLDIYKKRYLPEKHLGLFSAYVLFFPKFVSGPIERPSQFLTQLKQEHRFNSEDFIEGSKLIFWGMFKKLVIADRLAIAVNVVYSDPASYGSFWLAAGTLFFGLQLYFDFSGYTNIAIGAARLMGYRLTENFKRPYLAKSVSEFWKRWHISLSSWFQDYVFVPIYLKVSKLKSLAKLDSKKKHSISFIISILLGEILLGIWHGANLTFVFFGLYYGLVITLYYLVREKWDKMNNYLQIIFTFLLVNISWIFFRANDISDAFFILKEIFLIFPIDISSGIVNHQILGLVKNEFLLAIAGCVFFMAIEILHEKGKSITLYDKLPRVIKIIIYSILLATLLMFGLFSYTQFIYPQF